MTRKVDKALEIGVETVQEWFILLFNFLEQREMIHGRPVSNLETLLNRLGKGDLSKEEFDRRVNTKATLAQSLCSLTHVLNDFDPNITVGELMGKVCKDFDILQRELQVLALAELRAQEKGLLK